MAHEHMTRALLEAVMNGDVPATRLIGRLLEHLAETCRECREELEMFLGVALEGPDPDLGAETMPDPPAVPPAFWSLVDAERRHREEQLLPRARNQVKVLLALPAADRFVAVRKTTDLHNPVLVQLLLDRYWSRLTVDPDEALHLAKLAEEVAQRVPTERYGRWLRRDLNLRTRACGANALRAAGDLKAADSRLSKILVEVESSPEPLLRAEIYSFGASLRLDQRRFDDAESLLVRAFGIYREVNDLPKAAGILVSQANLLHKQGRSHEAVPLLRQALDLLDAQEYPRLALGAGHNLANVLCECGEPEQAQEVLEAHADLYRHHSDFYFSLRKLWVEGRIAHGTDRDADAERLFVEVRDGFSARGLGYDTALVSLDLAMLYVEQGRTADVRRLAEEMVPIFQAQDVHREATAALLIFHRAAAAETVSVRMVRDLSDYLRRARQDPRLRRELPS